MSRIGNEAIAIPAGVDVKVGDGNNITVKGPLGTLNQTLSEAMSISMSISKEGSAIKVTSPSKEKEFNSLHGLTRTLLDNMVVGVTKGFTKQLEINGVGYRAAKNGKILTLTLGYSHPIIFNEENGISFDVPNQTTIIVKGINKQLVGEIAAQIRSKRPPEPYLGKGVKYAGEHIRRKTGKAGK